MFVHTQEGLSGNIEVTFHGDSELFEEDELVTARFIFKKEEFLTDWELKDSPRSIHSFIKLFAEKHLNGTYKTNTSIKDFTFSFDEERSILTVTGYNGTTSMNGGIQRFMSRLDVSLFYFTMALDTLGMHFKMLSEIIREKHQWHWLGEERNDDVLLFQE